jgi:hypothetical protein
LGPVAAAVCLNLGVDSGKDPHPPHQPLVTHRLSADLQCHFRAGRQVPAVTEPSREGAALCPEVTCLQKLPEGALTTWPEQAAAVVVFHEMLTYAFI